MQANRISYAQHFDRPDLERMLKNAEDRQGRADTTEAALSDAYVIQELRAAIEMKGEK